MKHYRLVSGFVILFVLMTVCVTKTAVAEEGWEVAVGAGVFGENVYPGSDDRYVAPMPSLKVSYTKGEYTCFLSILEGLGVTYMNRDYGLLGSVTVNAGDKRNREDYSVVGFSVKHSDRTKKLLENTPNVSTSISTSAMLGYLTPVGIIGASASYHPTTVAFDRNGIKDRVHHGFLYSILYMIERPVTNHLSFSGMFGLEFMDKHYADAWYAVDPGTGTLDAFEADAGLRDIQIAFQVDYNFSKRVGISLLGANTILLQDAKKSPYTVESVQHAMTLQTFYNF